MDSPSESAGEYPTRIAGRSSMMESFRGCGLSGMRIDKVELRRRLLMPQSLRFAMRDSIRFKDPRAGETRLLERGNSVSASAAEEDEKPPHSPMVVFINARSGGRHGPMLKERLQQLMSEEQVCNFLNLTATQHPHQINRLHYACMYICHFMNIHLLYVLVFGFRLCCCFKNSAFLDPCC